MPNVSLLLIGCVCVGFLFFCMWGLRFSRLEFLYLFLAPEAKLQPPVSFHKCSVQTVLESILVQRPDPDLNSNWKKNKRHQYGGKGLSSKRKKKYFYHILCVCRIELSASECVLHFILKWIFFLFAQRYMTFFWLYSSSCYLFLCSQTYRIDLLWLILQASVMFLFFFVLWTFFFVIRFCQI